MGFKVKKKKKSQFKAPSSYATGAATGGVSSSSGAARHKKKKRKTGLIVGLSILAVALIALSLTAYLVFREINGSRGNTAEDITVTIPEGASTAQVAQVLKENDIIGNEMIFKLYSRFNKADGTYQLGEHVLNGTLAYDQIIEVLQQITVKDVETVSITFPEGTTALKMALMLEEQGICSVDEFINACNNDVYDVGFYSQISHENKFVALEGFLFPDTYEFEVGTSVHDMIQKMLENFEAKVLTAERQALLDASGYTLEEIITLSSIVEKESVGHENYAQVAAVFYNRLNSDAFPCLESDTSCDWRKRGLEEQEDYYGGYYPGVLQYYYGGYENIPEGVRDGYDTFSHEGLIVGAICNPGIVAIDGTLSPTADWPYYFFFTTGTVEENNVEYYWSETADEHAQQWADTH